MYSTPSTSTDLLTLAERHVRDLKAPRNPRDTSRTTTSRDVVLITGTTGNFGTDLLEILLRDDTVDMVYALNRRNSQPLQRQHAAFQARGFDDTLLSAPKFKMIEGDFGAPNFDIPHHVFDEMRNSVTCIIHNAWHVNFNQPVASFEPYLVALRELIDFALSSPFTVPPKIQFVGSIAVFQNYTSMLFPVLEEALDPASAIGTGYGESKWVAEKILLTVAEHTNLPVQIVRLAQICGNEGGYWNKDEWFPAIVRSASLVGCLPDIDGDAAFIPNSAAARALIEMRSSPLPIMHLVHPRPSRFHALLTTVSDELGIPIVPFASWFRTLENSARSIAHQQSRADYVDAIKKNPAIGLLGFFRTVKFAQGNEATNFLELSTEKAQAASITLRHLPELDENVAIRWMDAWRTAGFLVY